MNKQYFFVREIEDNDHKTREEIRLSPVQANKIEEMLMKPRPYNGEPRQGKYAPRPQAYARRGMATERQRGLISEMHRNPEQHGKMEQYIRENAIDMTTLTNAQANAIILAGKF